MVLEGKTRTGRPLGPDRFYAVVERVTGINPIPGMSGRPKKKQ